MEENLEDSVETILRTRYMDDFVKGDTKNGKLSSTKMLAKGIMSTPKSLLLNLHAQGTLARHPHLESKPMTTETFATKVQGGSIQKVGGPLLL